MKVHYAKWICEIVKKLLVYVGLPAVNTRSTWKQRQHNGKFTKFSNFA